jgi:hypothetical protein
VSGEELVLIEGRLTMSGASIESGHYAWVPPGFLRYDTLADRCSALAWFNGPARWVSGDPDGSGAPPEMMVTSTSAEAPEPTPFGVVGRPLRRGGDISVWLLSEPVSLVADDRGWVQAVSIPGRRFVHLTPGQEYEMVAPPLVVRSSGYP